ncbi:hypothetical protein [Bacillus mojavensis]
MNFITRKTVKEKDIFKTCDFYAVKNNNGTYSILYNKNGGERGVVDNETFKIELTKSNEPIVLNASLFRNR